MKTNEQYLSLDFIKWAKEYKNKEIIDLKKYLLPEDFEIIQKLDIKIKDKIYTEYEFELLDMELFSYYINEDMSEEEIKLCNSLEGTQVSQEEYNKLINKIFKISQLNFKN